MRSLTLLSSALLLTACAAKVRLPTEPAWTPAGPQGLLRMCLPVFPDEKPPSREVAQAWIDAVGLMQTDPGAVRGRLMTAEGHPAVDTLRALTSMNADDPAVREQAGAELLQLVERYPDDVCLLQTAAWVVARGGDPERARQLVDKAWALAPGDPDVAILRAASRESDDETAVESLDQALAAHPEHPTLNLVRATFYLRAAEDEPAIPHLIVARDAGLDVMDLLLKAYWVVGDFEGYLREASRLGMPLGDGGKLATSENPIDDFASVLGIGPGQTLYATLETSQGEIVCTLMPDMAPLTVANFVGLARGVQPWIDPATGQPGAGPFYDGTIFHRAIPGFMIQGGDRTGTGRGDPGYRFPDEANAAVAFASPGILAMANSGPDTNGSQFFITDAPTPHLDGRHTIFGVCDAAGQAVVRAIAALPRDASDKPVEDVVLERVIVEAR